MPLESGDYYIVNPASNQVIGPIGVGEVRPLGAIGPVGSVKPPVFRLEHTEEPSPWGTVFYKIYLKEVHAQRTYAEGDKVLATSLLGPFPTSWLVYEKEDKAYGIVDQGDDGLRAWTLPILGINTIPVEIPIILQSFPTTPRIPPGFSLDKWQVFSLAPVGPNE